MTSESPESPEFSANDHVDVDDNDEPRRPRRPVSGDGWMPNFRSATRACAVVKINEAFQNSFLLSSKPTQGSSSASPTFIFMLH